MEKSLEFVKNRIESGMAYGFENTHFESLTEHDSRDTFKSFHIFYDDKSETKLICKLGNDDKPDLEINIIYSPDAEFEYFTMESCRCDGTLLFVQELMEKCVEKIIRLKTYNKDKQLPSDLSGHKITYTVGDFVVGTEYGEQFSTKEKPWMMERFTVMLPIKFDVE